MEGRAWGSDGRLVGEEWKNEELKMTDSWELRGETGPSAGRIGEHFIGKVVTDGPKGCMRLHWVGVVGRGGILCDDGNAENRLSHVGHGLHAL